MNTNRPRMQRPPSALSNMRPPTAGSRAPSRAASNSEGGTTDRPQPVKRNTTTSTTTTTTTSAASSSTTSSRTHEHAPLHAASTNHHTTTTETTETNIQVVVRCRDRNKREIEENSGVILSPGRDGHTITVQTSALTELSNKTYSFDRVFSGGASQKDVFDLTVEPIVQEVRRA